MIQKETFMPHYLDTMANENIIELISIYKTDGYGIYWMIMEHLFRQKEHKSSLKVMKILGKQWGVSASKLEKILCNFGLFCIENNIVSSPELSESTVNSDKNSSKFNENSGKFDEKPTRMEAKTTQYDEETRARKKHKPLNVSNKHEEYADCESPSHVHAHGGNARISTTTTNNINNSSNSSSSSKKEKTSVQTWEESVNELSTDESWKEIQAMRSQMGTRFIEQFPVILSFFKEHIRSYGKESSIISLSDAKNYFSNFIVPGSITHKVLTDRLNQSSPPNPYRHEDKHTDGTRSYCGLPLPHDAPPRPSENANWNGREWE